MELRGDLLISRNVTNSGFISGVTNIYMSGSIIGAQSIQLSGHVVTAATGTLFVDGVQITGSGGGSSGNVVTTSGGIAFVFNQITPATTWNVGHNQNTTSFAVTCIDTSINSGTVFIPLSIDIVDANNVTIQHSIATKGKAVFVFANAVPTPVSGALQYTHTQTFTSTTWNVNHNLTSTNYVVTVFDQSGFVVIPDNIQTISSTSVQITFPYAAAGTAVFIGQVPSVSVVQQSNYKFTQSVAATTWTIAHNLNTQDFVIDTFDSSGNMFIPSGIVILDNNNIQVLNTVARAGKAIVQFQNAIIDPATSGSIYVHSQATNSTIWTINHSQNSRNYIINTFDQSGNLYIPFAVQTVDANTVKVTNQSSISGTAVLAFRTGVTPSAPPQNMYVFTQSVSGQVWNIAHNLNTRNYSITTFDQSGNVYLPNTISTLDANNIQVVNAIPKIGSAVVIFQNANIAPYNATQFTYLQGTAASTWNINHNLSTTQFNISMFDTSGFYFLPDDIRIVDANNVQVTSVTPIAGTAVLTFQNAKITTFAQGAPFEQRITVASGVTQSIFNINRLIPLTFFQGVDRGKVYQISLDGTGPLMLDTNNTARDNDYFEIMNDGTDGFTQITLNQAVVGPANLIVWSPQAFDSSSYSISQLTTTTALATQATTLSYMRRIGGSTRGSSNTQVVIYSTSGEAGGTDITYTPSATLGDSFLINNTGTYHISMTFFSSTTQTASIVVSGSIINGNGQGIGTRALTTVPTGSFGNANWEGLISAGQLVYILNTAALSTTNGISDNQITIARVR